MIKYLVVFLTLLFCWGCSNNALVDERGLRNYLKNEQNGLIKTIKKGQVTFEATYSPVTYEALKGVGFQIADSTSFLQALEEVTGHHYIHFKVAPQEKYTTLEEVSKALDKDWRSIKKELDFYAKTQFHLEAGTAALPCVLYQPFDGLNAKNGYSFMVLFKDDQVDYNSTFTDDLTFAFTDKQFTGETIELTFAQTDLNKIPLLKF